MGRLIYSMYEIRRNRSNFLSRKPHTFLIFVISINAPIIFLIWVIPNILTFPKRTLPPSLGSPKTNTLSFPSPQLIILQTNINIYSFNIIIIDLNTSVFVYTSIFVSIFISSNGFLTFRNIQTLLLLLLLFLLFCVGYGIIV